MEMKDAHTLMMVKESMIFKLAFLALLAVAFLYDFISDKLKERKSQNDV